MRSPRVSILRLEGECVLKERPGGRAVGGWTLARGQPGRGRVGDRVRSSGPASKTRPGSAYKPRHRSWAQRSHASDLWPGTIAVGPIGQASQVTSLRSPQNYGHYRGNSKRFVEPATLAVRILPPRARPLRSS